MNREDVSMALLVAGLVSLAIGKAKRDVERWLGRPHRRRIEA